VRIAAIAAVMIAVAGCSPAPPSDRALRGKACDTTVHVFLNVDAKHARERRIGHLIDGIPTVTRSTTGIHRFVLGGCASPEATS